MTTQPDAPASRKLAQYAADRIIADIAAIGWPVGEVLGSETELLERYGVSRAVFREAVRIVEHLEVARMRRGPGGGLVVAEPTIDAATSAVIVYLNRIRPDFDEAIEARLDVEDLAVEFAVARRSDNDIETLRELAAREVTEPPVDRKLHAVLAEQSRNPALELFVAILDALTHVYSPDLRDVTMASRREVTRAHAPIVDAVIAGDGELARRRMRVHIEHEAQWIRNRNARRRWPNPLPAPGANAKRAEAISNEIFGAIVADGWHVGSYVGSEADLMTRYDVSRAVLREAIRLLEHHHVAAMRRGPGGGLFVVEPTAAAVAEAAAVYLERRHTNAVHLAEVRIGLELALLDLTIKRLDDDGIAALRAALEAERAATPTSFDEVGHDIHTVIAQLSGNRLLELFVRVLVRLTDLHQRRTGGTPGALPQPSPRGIEAVQRSHEGIVEAIIARDAECARDLMRRHLERLAGFLR